MFDENIVKTILFFVDDDDLFSCICVSKLWKQIVLKYYIVSLIRNHSQLRKHAVITKWIFIEHRMLDQMYNNVLRFPNFISKAMQDVGFVIIFNCCYNDCLDVARKACAMFGIGPYSERPYDAYSGFTFVSTWKIFLVYSAINGSSKMIKWINDVFKFNSKFLSMIYLLTKKHNQNTKWMENNWCKDYIYISILEHCSEPDFLKEYDNLLQL